MFASRTLTAARLGARTLATAATKKIGVVGMGLMGHGIVQCAATAGFEVVAIDANPAAMATGRGMVEKSVPKMLERQVKKGKMTADEAAAEAAATLGRITYVDDLGAATDADMMVEAIVEDMTIKKKFWSDVGAAFSDRPDTIFASNTSSLPITDMAVASGRPDKFVGLHFFNPVQLMPLVEVVRTEHTSEEAFAEAHAVCAALPGKQVVSCSDTPGFLVNRLLVPYMSSAMLLVERGHGTVADTDTAMRLGAGHPMGPFTLADYVGLDTCLSILEGWSDLYPGEAAFAVPESLRAKVEAGHFGRKNGRGFYVWDGNKPVGEAE